MLLSYPFAQANKCQFCSAKKSDFVKHYKTFDKLIQTKSNSVFEIRWRIKNKKEVDWFFIQRKLVISDFEISSNTFAENMDFIIDLVFIRKINYIFSTEI